MIGRLKSQVAALAKVYQALALASASRSRRVGPHRHALATWIAQHMPELDAELGPLSLDQVRVRLNAITGCTVGPADSVELGSAVFLAALQAQHERRAAP